MNRIDESSNVSEYFYLTLKTIDGKAWFAGCIASILGLIDIFFGLNIFPFRHAENSEKLIALLLTSPLLIFLILVRLRQLPFNQSIFSAWIRAFFCLLVFVTINFLGY